MDNGRILKITGFDIRVGSYLLERGDILLEDGNKLQAVKPSAEMLRQRALGELIYRPIKTLSNDELLELACNTGI